MPTNSFRSKLQLLLSNALDKHTHSKASTNDQILDELTESIEDLINQSVLSEVGSAHSGRVSVADLCKVVTEVTYNWEYWISPEGDLLFSSPSCADITGYTKEEFINDRGLLASIIHEDYRESFREHAERVSASNDGEWHNLHVKIVRKDGAVRWMGHACQSVHDANGNYLGIRGSNSDITNREMAEVRKAWFDALIENSDNIAAVKDLNLRVIAANSIFCKYSGHESVSGLLGKTDAEIFGIPAHKEPVKSYMEDERKVQKLPKGEYIVKEEPFITVSGKEITLLTKKYPIYDDKGKLIATGNISTDITSRIIEREQLESNNALLNTLMDNLQVGVFMVDAPSGKPILINKRAEEILGRNAVEDANLDSITQVYDAFLAGTDKHYPNESAPLIRAINGECTWVDDMEILHPDGSRVLIEVYGAPVKDGKGQIVAGLVNFVDITDRRKAKDTLEQERILLRTLIDTLPDAIYVKDTKSRKVIANIADCQNLGYESEEQLLGKNDFDVFPHEVAQPFFEDDQTVISTGNPVVNRQERLLRPSGEELWLLTTKLPLYDAKGKVVGLLGIGRNITQQKIATDALSESQQLQENILNTVPVRVFWKDKELRFLGCNKPFANDAGFDDPNELIGKDDYQMVWADQAEHYRNDDMQVIVSGESKIGFEEPQTTSDGKLRWLRTSKIPLRNTEGEVFGVLGTYEDITESKKSEKKLKEQNEEYLALNEELTESNSRILNINEELDKARRKAEESDRLKTAFLANMSHEIRTPMNSIIGFSDILLRPDLQPQKQRYFTEIINSSCHQLLSVINDVIDISKIETNQVDVFEGEVKLNKLLRRTHSIYSLEGSRKAVEVTLNLGLNDRDATIITDESKLMQIINNLVSNAVKFTEHGSVSMGYTKKSDAQLEFFVRDSGIGISQEHHKVIFQRFRQVELTDSRKYGGTGLGLSIAKAFVDMFGGEIWVESELGNGSTFYFTLPYKIAAVTRDTSQQDESTTYSFAGKNILLAEDEAANHLLINELLQDTGVGLTCVSNGAEAVRVFQEQNDIDLILMDIKMPVMNGLDAIRCIRTLDGRVPIIALTAYAMSGDKERCLDAGANEYLPKPVVKSDFLNLLRGFFEMGEG